MKIFNCNIRFIGVNFPKGLWHSVSTTGSGWSLCRLFIFQIFIFNQMIALQKLWKMFFISSKMLFLFLRYSNFCISVFPLFLPVSHCFRGWSDINLKVYDVINNKNLITHFVWYLGKENSYDIETLSIW